MRKKNQQQNVSEPRETIWPKESFGVIQIWILDASRYIHAILIPVAVPFITNI